MTSLITFTLFPDLPLEIRNKIWALTLPPSRIIRVVPEISSSKESICSTSKESFYSASKDSLRSTSSTYYKAAPCSWGGIHPAILSINHDSRTVALHHLTARFECYWNFSIDILYIELATLGAQRGAGWQLADMRKRGLLQGVKHLALDWQIWDMCMFDPRSKEDEHCTQTLRHHLGLESCTFILRPNYVRMNRCDVVVPGVPWRVVPAAEGSGMGTQNTNALEGQFLSRVEKGLKGGMCNEHRGPKDVYFKAIGSREFVKTEEWKPRCPSPGRIRSIERGRDFFG